MSDNEGKGRLVVATPVISTSAYAAGDQMGGVLTLTAAVDATSDTATLISVTVIDKAGQSSDLDVLFFNASPTVASSDNAALSISDAEMAQKFIGRVKISSTDYSTTAAGSDATKSGIGLFLQAYLTNNLYAIVQCQGSPTYTSTSDLVLKFGILQD